MNAGEFISLEDLFFQDHSCLPWVGPIVHEPSTYSDSVISGSPNEPASADDDLPSVNPYATDMFDENHEFHTGIDSAKTFSNPNYYQAQVHHYTYPHLEVGLNNDRQQHLSSEWTEQKTSASHYLVPSSTLETNWQMPPDYIKSELKNPPIASDSSVQKIPEVRLCQVCGEQAGKHSYYGGQVCPSCRAFFRRSVQSRYSDTYTCSKTKDCVITLKTRKNCQYCRFRLCEKAGMKRSWVLADGERKNKKNFPQRHGMTKLPTEPLVELTQSEKNEIEYFLEIDNVVKHQIEHLTNEHMTEMVHLFRNEDIKMSEEGRRSIRKILEQRYRLFAINIQDFVRLSQSDQINLIEHNAGCLINLGLAVFFHSSLNWRRQLEMLLGQTDATRLTELLIDLKLSENKQMNYDQFFFSPWCVSEAFEKKHKHLIFKISQWVQDRQTFVLLNLMMLFSTESLELDNPGYISNKQLEYSRLLQRYLYSKFPKDEARAKFSNGILIISYCRELHSLVKDKCQGPFC